MVAKGLDKLRRQLELGEFQSGRGAEKLSGTKIHYMRSGGEARLYYRYCPTDEKVLELLGESNKKNPDKVIEILRAHYT